MKRQIQSIASWHNQLTSAEDRTPATHTGNDTPVSAEGEVDEGESGEVAAVPVVEVVPTCYRLISTSKSSPDAPTRQDVPLILHTHLVTTSAAPASARQRRGCNNGDTGASSSGNSRNHWPRLSVMWTDAWQRGSIGWSVIGERNSCGMERLHVLEERLGAVAV